MAKTKRARSVSPAGDRKRPAPRNRSSPRAGATLSQPGRPPGKAFPIVGLGASAGGLEALEEFFAHMPARNGMAFVVVTHQHPDHTSLLPELLGKHTEMTVVAARDGQRVAPNCVYLCTPAHNLAMRHGALHSSESKPH